MRRMPYVPILRSTPARITEIAVGASTCASGSQVWKGKAGILIAKPMNSATHRITWTSSGIFFASSVPSCVMSKECGSAAK